MQIIGSATVDYEAFKTWFVENPLSDSSIFKEFLTAAELTRDQDFIKEVDKHLTHYYRRKTEFHTPNRTEDALSELIAALHYAEKLSIPFNLYFETASLALVGFASHKSRFIIPQEFLHVTRLKNYDEVQLSALESGAPGNSAALALPKDTTVSQVRTALEDLRQEQGDLQREREAIESAASGELAELKAQLEALQKTLEAKKADMMAIYEKAKEELDLKMEQMNNQLFVLDSQIYAIRCYTGEVIQFTKLRSGLPAKPDTPLVIHQRLRFLDEELGKLVSLYNIDFDDVKEFETLLSVSDGALETFCPSDRTMTLVRVSKDNTAFNAHLQWHNMLDAYAVYHGQTIGILLRDGDNLYLGWTDDSRVNFKDNAFYTPGKTRELPPEMQQDKYESDERYAARMKDFASRNRLEVVSRFFVFNILQGAIDNQALIQFPGKVQLGKPSPYLVFSAADFQLDDHRFVTFEEVMKRCNQSVLEGDHILSMQYLRPLAGTSYRRGRNDRGRGWANRTHDVSLKDCSILPINLVERDASEKHVFYRTPTSQEVYRSYHVDCTEYNLDSNMEYLREEIVLGRLHYFVSLKKGWSLSGEARANFEVYSNEFINLTYLCSTWVRYFIESKHLGDLRIGGQRVNYAYLIQYLNKALDFIRSREEEEARLIGAYANLAKYQDWPALLSEWKLENHIRSITPYQAKRFAKKLTSPK